MKRASDFRKIARDALRGNWLVAILTTYVASLIGASVTSGGVNFSFGGGGGSSDGTTSEPLTPEMLEKILPFLIAFLVIFIILMVISSIYSLVIFIISGAGKLGYAKFNLNLVDGKPAQLSDLFSQFKRLGDGILMTLLVGIYTFLWSLLLIIPGIIKGYSYAMTPYILLECPGIKVNDAITKSRMLMDGNKWRLFCLNLSFIGWSFLCIAPVFILSPLIILGPLGVILLFLVSLPLIFVASLFLSAYQEAARAAFYREISRTDVAPLNPEVQDCTSVDG